jgi:hypothetical protein
MAQTSAEPQKQGDFVLGLDLGQSSDYTALAVAQRTWRPRPGQPNEREAHYAIRHLKRWPLKTPYPAIVADLAALVRTPPLFEPVLAVDQTGVGQAVVDMIRQNAVAAELRPVLITAGQKIEQDEAGVWHCPKRELVSTLHVLLQNRRLTVAALPERELLVKELLAFRVKITAAANETFEAWRERDHDDLVLAGALACWVGERVCWWGPDDVIAGGESLVAQMPADCFLEGGTEPGGRRDDPDEVREDEESGETSWARFVS